MPLKTGAWFPNAWAGEADFDEAQMEVRYVKFTPFDEQYECPAESYPDFGWAPGTDIGLGSEELCGSSPPSPMSPSPSPPPTHPVVGQDYLTDGCAHLPSTFCDSISSGSYCKNWQSDECGRSVCNGDSHDDLNPCNSPNTPSPITPGPSKQPTQSPVATAYYLDNGCADLPKFCASNFPGSYCKNWKQDVCGRSVCHGAYYSLNSCDTSSDLETYKSDGCANLPESFCHGYNGGYCKTYQSDDCGRR